uniref:Uncharacterized protein n=1 Tax=Anguilla anguilla TaxID=7936 RepID=A0A0E9W0C7_ANGAN
MLLPWVNNAGSSPCTYKFNIIFDSFLFLSLFLFFLFLLCRLVFSW